MAIPSWHLVSHSGQCSLAILQWVGAMSTGKGHSHCQDEALLPGLMAY